MPFLTDSSLISESSGLTSDESYGSPILIQIFNGDDETGVKDIRREGRKLRQTKPKPKPTKPTKIPTLKFDWTFSLSLSIDSADNATQSFVVQMKNVPVTNLFL